MKPSALVGGGRRMERYREARLKRRGPAGAGNPNAPAILLQTILRGASNLQERELGKKRLFPCSGRRSSNLRRGPCAGGPLGRRTRFREGCDLSVRPPDSAGGRGCVSSSRPLGF